MLAADCAAASVEAVSHTAESVSPFHHRPPPPEIHKHLGQEVSETSARQVCQKFCSSGDDWTIKTSQTSCEPRSKYPKRILVGSYCHCAREDTAKLTEMPQSKYRRETRRARCGACNRDDLRLSRRVARRKSSAENHSRRNALTRRARRHDAHRRRHDDFFNRCERHRAAHLSNARTHLVARAGEGDEERSPRARAPVPSRPAGCARLRPHFRADFQLRVPRGAIGILLRLLISRR